MLAVAYRAVQQQEAYRTVVERKLVLADMNNLGFDAGHVRRAPPVIALSVSPRPLPSVAASSISRDNEQPFRRSWRSAMGASPFVNNFTAGRSFEVVG